MIENNIANQLQQDIAYELDSRLSGFASRFFPESSLDIGYEVKQWLGKVGAVGIVTTPQLNYIGHNQIGPAYDAIVELQIAENPTVHRAELKRSSLDSGTGMDLSLSAQCIAADVGGQKFGRLCPGNITQQLENGLVVTRSQLTGTICYEPEAPRNKWTCLSSVHPEAVGEYVQKNNGIFYGPNGCRFEIKPQSGTLGSGWNFILKIPDVIEYNYGVISEQMPNYVDFTGWKQASEAMFESQQKTPHSKWVSEDPAIELVWHIQNSEPYDQFQSILLDRYYTADNEILMLEVHLPNGKNRYELHYEDQVSIYGDQEPDVQELDFALSDGTHIIFSKVEPN